VVDSAFLLRAAGWAGLNVALLVAGAVLGAMLTPKVNPHNDWGVTGFIYSSVGALLGTTSTIVLLLWIYARNPGPGRAGSAPRPPAKSDLPEV
jgi:hypothetical protein